MNGLKGDFLGISGDHHALEDQSPVLFVKATYWLFASKNHA